MYDDPGRCATPWPSPQRPSRVGSSAPRDRRRVKRTLYTPPECQVAGLRERREACLIAIGVHVLDGLMEQVIEKVQVSVERRVMVGHRIGSEGQVDDRVPHVSASHSP